MRRFVSLLCLAAALAAILAPAAADAIPAFARRYRFSCTTCHAPFPKLKPFGEEFAGRGFALEPGTEPARANVDLGDDLLQLPREIPLAVRFDAFVLGQDGDPKLDFQSPWAVKLLAGGQIANGVSLYGYYILEQGEPGKVEDLFLTVSSPFGAPLDVTIGQFQISDPIAKRELRLQRLDYEILTVRPGASRVDLTYDRGLAVASGLGPVDLFLTVTNGNGIGPGDPTLDDDKFKNFGLNVWAHLGALSIGAYGFAGTETGSDLATPDVREKNEIFYLGPEVRLGLRDVIDVNAAWLERRDSNPGFLATGAETVRTGGGYVEVVGYPAGHDGRWIVSAVYNHVESDDDAAKRESAGLAVNWLLRRNVRLVAEADRDFEGDAWAGSVGTVAAF
jgi:hypothetical protein